MNAFVRRLLARSREELDALYSAQAAGPIPDGPAEGTAIIAPGTRLAYPVARLTRVLAWQGKVFDAERGVMCNRVLPFGIRAVVARIYRAPSWLDGQECIVLNYSRTSMVARRIRDEIRQVAPNVYLGKAYWNKSRLIDFALEFGINRY